MILFHQAGTNAIILERIAIILGIITFISVLLILASCRSSVAFLNRSGLKSVTDNRIFQKFYHYHAYFWWFSGIFLLSHLMLAVIHTGWPEASDSDAGLQWVLLSVGLINLGLVLTIFSSCRISPRLLGMVKPDFARTNRSFQRFFRQHTFYWGVLILVIFGHIAAGYLHAGIWPE